MHFVSNLDHGLKYETTGINSLIKTENGINQNFESDHFLNSKIPCIKIKGLSCRLHFLISRCKFSPVTYSLMHFESTI